MSYDRPSMTGGTYQRPAADSARIQFRRALMLTIMTLFMPGSAQLVMGNRRVGRIAIRVWLGVLGAVAFVVILGLTSRTSLFSIMTNSTMLHIVRIFLIVAAIGWVGLLVDAWRLGTPIEMRRNHRLAMTGINALLCFATSGAMLFGAHLVAVQNDFIGTVFASQTVSEPQHGRYNILLMGGDSGPDRSGLRPDSMTVASVDKDTGRTVLIGLPRNMLGVPFPKGSVMDKQFPDGFDCDGCELNAINTWVNNHPKLFKGQKTPGISATRESIEEITGLKINYYAMVNMHGFSSLIDALGGVRVNVRQRTAIGGIGSPIRAWIPAGEQKLTGDQALWYGRSRVQNDDWSRMGRQKCIMYDMLHQLSPQKVILNVEKIAKSSAALLTTNIPQQDLDVFMDLALKARTQKVSTVSLVPPEINTSDPDFSKIRRMIDGGIARAEGKTSSTTGVSNAELPVVNLASVGQTKDPRKANSTDDLTTTC